MLGRFAPGNRRADGPGQVTGDVSIKYDHFDLATSCADDCSLCLFMAGSS